MSPSSLIFLFVVGLCLKFYHIKGCTPVELDVYIDDLALLSSDTDNVLVTDSDGNCYLYSIPDVNQQSVDCSDYSDDTIDFTSADSDATSTSIDSIELQKGGANDTLDFEMTRNNQTLIISITLDSSFNDTTTITTSWNQYNYWTVNSINTTIIILQTQVNDQDEDTWFAFAFMFDSQDSNSYVATELDILNENDDIFYWGYVYTSDDARNVWQELSLVYLDIALDSCTYSIYTNYYLEWDGDTDTISGLGLYQVGYSSFLDVDVINNRAFDWIGIYQSEYLYIYTFDVQDNGNVTYDRQSYEFDLTGNATGSGSGSGSDSDNKEKINVQMTSLLVSLLACFTLLQHS